MGSPWLTTSSLCYFDSVKLPTTERTQQVRLLLSIQSGSRRRGDKAARSDWTLVKWETVGASNRGQSGVKTAGLGRLRPAPLMIISPPINQSINQSCCHRTEKINTIDLAAKTKEPRETIEGTNPHLLYHTYILIPMYLGKYNFQMLVFTESNTPFEPEFFQFAQALLFAVNV